MLTAKRHASVARRPDDDQLARRIEQELGREPEDFEPSRDEGVFAQIGVGLLLGLGSALAIAAVAGNGVQNVLFGVSARDPLTYGTVVALVTFVSLVATFVPARRATRVDPMTALRAE